MQPGAGRAARPLLLGVRRSVEQRPGGKVLATSFLLVLSYCSCRAYVGLLSSVTYWTFRHWTFPAWGAAVLGAVLGLFHALSLSPPREPVTCGHCHYPPLRRNPAQRSAILVRL